MWCCRGFGVECCRLFEVLWSSVCRLGVGDMEKVVVVVVGIVEEVVCGVV